MMLVRPSKPNMVIRDPRSRAKLPPYGGSVPNSSYWHRCLNYGDVVPTTSDAISEGKAEAERKAATKAAKPKKKSSGKGNR